MNTPSPQPLQYLSFGAFAAVMGLSGLSLAWARAQPFMGAAAGIIAWVIGVAALLLFALLGGLSLLRWQRHPLAVLEDLRHPVRQSFVAAVPASVILLATVVTMLAGPSVLARTIWGLGAASQLAMTVWLLSRWLWTPGRGGFQWAGITPVLFIAVVGNVLVPLAGVPLGMAEWSAAQLGVGLLWWPVVLTLLVVRIGQQGLWPERLLPATFIALSPPAVIGVALLQMGAPPSVAWAMWGMGLFFLAWSASVFKRIIAQPFGLGFWGMSFPLAAYAALGLRLAESASPAFLMLSMALLALATIAITGLVAGTVQGLRRGTLLIPDPVPPATQAQHPGDPARSHA